MTLEVLITGAGGQLGYELQRTVPPGVNAVALGRAQLDITSAEAVACALNHYRPQVIVNAAAYTAVDKAEQERELAAAVNATGPQRLARAAADRNLRLIHVSTDFVFDGAASAPYRPDDAPGPLGVYGATKLEGEERVLAAADDHAVVLRTGWVYSRHGGNFVKTMLRIMREREEIGVVADQVGTPTWARGLAETVWRFVLSPDITGIFHWSDAGVASWYDFAVAIEEEGRERGLLTRPVKVRPIATCEYPTPARRPAYSVLDKSATWSALGQRPMHWRTALRSMLCETC